MKQQTNGYWYWTINGSWLLDEDGQMVLASAIDGKDGKDGKDDVLPATSIPIININSTTNLWEISTDNGVTWVSTGIPANGKDGKNGRVDIFGSVTPSDDGSYLIVRLADGVTVFNIPIIKS